MAFTLSRNLKLRLDTNLTANARYNLEKLDTLGSTFIVDSTESLNLRSITDINIEPESADIGGSGSGGDLNIGNASHLLDAVNIYTSSFQLTSPIRLLDQASGGTKYLSLQYKSDVSGSADTSADRSLSLDLEGANRSVSLGGNFSLSGGSLTLSLSADSSLTLPTTGTVATLAGSETLTNKTINADSNSISNIRNADVASSAGIVYSKLDLTGGVVNADINASAAIAYSKLNLSNSITNADVNAAAAIQYSKLDLSSSIVNADISPSAAIIYSKLSLGNSIVNADISSSAAISGSKVTPNFGSQNIVTEGELRLSDGTYYTSLQTTTQSADIPLILPSAAPTGGQVLRANASSPTQLEWAAITGTGTVTSVDLSVTDTDIFTTSGGPVTAAGTLNLALDDQVANTILAGPTTGADDTPSFRALVAADIPTGIPADNIGSGDISNSEFQFLNGVSANIQTQLDSKQPLDADLTALAALSTTGVLARTAANTYVPRTITAGTGISIDDGDGVAGNPTINSTITQYTDSDVEGVLDDNRFEAAWINGDGTTKVISHSLNTSDVKVELYDIDSGESLWVDTETRTDVDTLTLVSSEAPDSGGSGWRVLVSTL